MHSDEGKSPELERVEPPVPNEASQTLVLATYHLLFLSCLTQVNRRGRILRLPLGDRSFGARQGFFWPYYTSFSETHRQSRSGQSSTQTAASYYYE